MDAVLVFLSVVAVAAASPFLVRRLAWWAVGLEPGLGACCLLAVPVVLLYGALLRALGY